MERWRDRRLIVVEDVVASTSRRAARRRRRRFVAAGFAEAGFVAEPVVAGVFEEEAGTAADFEKTFCNVAARDSRLRSVDATLPSPPIKIIVGISPIP